MAQILIVEDEPRISSFLGRALTSCGYSVDCANDEAPAIERLGRASYDIVLLDLMLPNGDGFSVLEQLNNLVPDQQVIVLSALGDVDAKVRCFDLGASDYLTKPFSLPELLARIRARIQHMRGQIGVRYLEEGGVRLDLHRRAAIANGKLIHLSTREFVLLEHLMRRQGEVCSRDELLRAVWGLTFDPGTNVVDVYVRRLRSKLGHNVIETIRNVGYCYAAVA